MRTSSRRKGSTALESSECKQSRRLCLYLSVEDRFLRFLSTNVSVQLASQPANQPAHPVLPACCHIRPTQSEPLPSYF